MGDDSIIYQLQNMMGSVRIELTTSELYAHALPTAPTTHDQIIIIEYDHLVESATYTVMSQLTISQVT